MKTYLYEIANDDGSTSHYISLVPPDEFPAGIPGEGLAGRLTDGPSHFDADHFAPNTRFIDVLQAVIAREGKLAPLLIAAARARGSGWIYMIDERTPDPDGEVPPEDILGAFEVADGRIGPYRASEHYRFLTTNGTPQLDTWVFNGLLTALRRLG